MKNDFLNKICPDNSEDCISIVKKHCPDLNEKCLEHLSQMDYYLVGRENYNFKGYKMENNINLFDNEYHSLIKKILIDGYWIKNERTGKKCLTISGEKCEYDLSSGYFPAITTKKLMFKSMVGELLGFIRGYDNAKDFRKLNCNFWNANANESIDWINNPNRKGTDDLGRIYGVQARNWISPSGEIIDQLKIIIDKLENNIDDRRLIVTHWNPGELDEMALPPCHDFYQFHLINNKLNLSMYQRSNDVPLGIPMNIASYSLLLLLMSRITNHLPGKFTHFMGDTHIYEDQYDLIKEQILRQSFNPPKIKINENIKNLNDLETWVTVNDFELINYQHHPEIKFPFAA